MFATTPNTRCEIISDPAELEDLRADWARLLEQTPHATFHQSLDWLEVRWQHRGERDLSLHVVVIRDARDTVIGIVPLIIHLRPAAIGSVRKLRFPIDVWGSYYGPIGPDPEFCLAIASSWLMGGRKAGIIDFDLLEFTTLPDYRAVRGEPPVGVTGGPRLEGEFAERWRVSECSHVAMLYFDEGGWESYWESRRAQQNRRRNVERCERRLEELGRVEHIRYRSAPGGDPRWDLYDACVDLATKSWQDGLVDGETLHHDKVRHFFRDAHEAAARAGASDLNLLTLDGTPVAFVHGYHYRGYVDLVRVGFDPAFAKFAPGNVLWKYLIEDSARRGDRVLDFGPCCLDYKRFWMTALETSHQAVLFTSSPAARAFQLARGIKTTLSLGLNAADHTNEEAKLRAAKNARALSPH